LKKKSSKQDERVKKKKAWDTSDYGESLWNSESSIIVITGMQTNKIGCFDDSSFTVIFENIIIIIFKNIL
jgi:hypothetical protein